MTSFQLVPTHRTVPTLDGLMSALVSGAIYGEAGPAYDIASLGEDRHEVALAVPGYTDDQLEITVENGTLLVRGKPASPGAEIRYVRQGIARGGFERRFALAEHVLVKGARLEHGVLHVELAREVPEALKPRTIRIGGDSVPQVESKAA